jgi:hypothetical protein
MPLMISALLQELRWQSIYSTMNFSHRIMQISSKPYSLGEGSWSRMVKSYLVVLDRGDMVGIRNLDEVDWKG